MNLIRLYANGNYWVFISFCLPVITSALKGKKRQIERLDIARWPFVGVLWLDVQLFVRFAVMMFMLSNVCACGETDDSWRLRMIRFESLCKWQKNPDFILFLLIDSWSSAIIIIIIFKYLPNCLMKQGIFHIISYNIFRES